MQPQAIGTIPNQRHEGNKLERWVMVLQENNITVVHIRGKDNILADAICQATHNKCLQ